jgi:hypothetical protein
VPGTYAVAVTVFVTVDAATPELAASGALVALAVAGFLTATVDEVIDVDEPLDLRLTAAGRARLAALDVADPAAVEVEAG